MFKNMDDAGGFKDSGKPTLAEPILESRAVYIRSYSNQVLFDLEPAAGHIGLGGIQESIPPFE